MWMSRGVAMNGALRNDKSKVLHDANKRSPLAPKLTTKNTKASVFTDSAKSKEKLCSIIYGP